MNTTPTPFLTSACLAMFVATAGAADLPHFISQFEADGPVTTSVSTQGTTTVFIVSHSGDAGERILKIKSKPGTLRIDRLGRHVDAARYIDEFWIDRGESETFVWGAPQEESPLPKCESFPIVAWGWPYSSKGVKAGRYRDIRESLCNMTIQWVADAGDARFCLDAANAAGIRLILHWDEIRTSPESAVGAVKDHPALAAYYVCDEPNVEKMHRLSDIARRIRALDGGHPLYMNWFGYLDNKLKWYGVPTFDEYVAASLRDIPAGLCTFDVYPIYAQRYAKRPFRYRGEALRLRDDWYHSLETVSAAARKVRWPFWAFANVVPIRNHPKYDNPIPTVGHLKLMQYSNLAYGAQGLQYYDFRPGVATMRDYAADYGPITPQGLRTPSFDRLALANREISSRLRVFRGATVRCVSHTGREIPEGTRRFSAGDLPNFVSMFDPGEDEFVVSSLVNKNVEIFMVLNRNPNRASTFTASFHPRAFSVDAEGTVRNAGAGRCALGVGDAAICFFQR